MEWKSATVKDDGTVLIPEQWLLLHYYEALNILFRMENALRVFTYVVLKNKFKDKWAETTIQTADDQHTTIASAASRRSAQAKGYGYLGYEITSPLMYLNSGELTNLICSEAYWNLFKPFFRGKKEIIKNKLDEIGTIRNALAHFRPLKYDDVEVIKQNMKHAFAGIEQCLTEMMQTQRIVPTNTDTDWYKNLTTLGSNRCTVQLVQDSFENWICCKLDYTSAVLRDAGSKFRRLSVTRLISPSVIKNFPGLARHCTFMTEYVPYVAIRPEKVVNITKQVSLTFSRNALAEHHQEIGEQIKDVLLRVETETELIEKDNLARGQLIDSVSVRSVLRTDDQGKEWWSANLDQLKCQFGENDPPEYWGDIGVFESDFIAGAVRYPWMPSDISKEEIPF